MPNNTALHKGLTASRAQTPEWQALARHHKNLGGMSIAGLFAADPARAQHFSAEHEGLFVDYSKHAITAETMALLQAYARACDLETERENLFSGGIVNTTENRPALHTALRGGKDAPFAPEIAAVLGQVKAISARVRNDRSIRAVVTIGIGGSDSGPRLACDVLKSYADPRIDMRFLTNIDPGDFTATLEDLKPENTLFIVSSKSFTTQETMTNAQSAKAWAGGDAGRFIAVTGNMNAVRDFGIAEEHILPMPDWVGGRYSLWSAIGLPIAISLGFENFQKLLAGARAADDHFRNTAPEQNIPVILGLLSFWHRNFENRPVYAVLPYDQRLALLPRYIQQIEMESNGKGVTRAGKALDYPAAPVVFGEIGTNGQHAFYQLLHQGDPVTPCDFILCAQPAPGPEGHHQKLVANALAQAQALAFGQENKAEPHRNFPGNRPSTTMILRAIDPHHLGLVLALFEHKVFVEGILWNINSFDQWGVELGKQLTGAILEAMDNKGAAKNLDASTQSLMEKMVKMA